MAAQAAIAAVQLQVPDEAEELGFDDTAIGALLDSGLSQSRTILAVLRGISAKASSFEDISEAGSSRTSRFFDNVKALIDVWTATVKDEDLATGTVAKESARIYTAVRV
jgi:hypothetical protein